jgi:quercetin dioxygenase-like cupin family protein
MTAPSAVHRRDLLSVALNAVASIERAQLTRIELPPGVASGAHRHPCDVVGTILSGSIQFEIDGQAATVLHTGDAFFEPRDSHVLRFDNAADNEPAVFLACYLIATDTTELITMDQALS